MTPGSIDRAIRYWWVIRQFEDVYRPDVDILEVGSGSGGVTEFLDHPVTGVDTAFDRTVVVGTPRLEQIVGTVTDLPMGDASFDVVLCIEMLEHIPAQERAKAFSEMLRVLRPGGRLVATFPADETARKLDAWLNLTYRKRHGIDHPWAVEHLEQGVPSTPEMESLVRGLLQPGSTLQIRKHAWAPSWKLQQLLFSVERGYPWTRAAGIHTAPTAKLLYLVMRHLNFGDCYRTVMRITKGPAGPISL